jgi:hypothetical protein
MISFQDNGDKPEHYIFPEEPGKPEITTLYPRGTVPTKVLAFVIVPDAQNRDDCPNDNSPNNIQAIVHCAKYQDCTDAKEGSILTETWKMEYHLQNKHDKLDKDRKPWLHLVGLHSFVDRVLAIKENPATKTCLYESVPLFKEKEMDTLEPMQTRCYSSGIMIIGGQIFCRVIHLTLDVVISSVTYASLQCL